MWLYKTHFTLIRYTILRQLNEFILKYLVSENYPLSFWYFKTTASYCHWTFLFLFTSHLDKSFCLTLTCLIILCGSPEELWTFPLPPSLLGLSLSTPITLFSETPVWCGYFRLWSHSCSFHFCNFISCQQGLGMWYYCTHTGWKSCEKAFLFLGPAGCCLVWWWWSAHGGQCGK